MTVGTGTAAEPVAPRGPAAAGHQGALDGLRAAAAGAVLVTHVGGLTGYTLTGAPLSWAMSRGDVGVPIFFALSGLLLYRPWATAALTGGAATRTASYLRRRALRILPAYWAVVIIALPLYSPGPARHVRSWLEYLLLVQNYDQHPLWAGTGAPGLAQMWSLVVEVSFYLVLPLLAAALTWFACRRGEPGGAVPSPGEVTRRACRLLAGIALTGLSSFGWTVLIYYPRPNIWLAGTLPPLMAWFAAGMAIAVVSAWAAAEPGTDGPASRFCRTVSASAGMCALAAAGAFAIACTPVTGPEFIGILGVWPTEARTALYTFIGLAIVAPVAFQPLWPGRPPGSLSARLLDTRVSRFLGRISYGFFLWQYLAAFAFFGLFHLKTVFHGADYSVWAVAAILIGVALVNAVFAAASYYLIELPAHRLRLGRLPGSSRRSAVRRSATPPASAGWLTRWVLRAGGYRVTLRRRADDGGGQPGQDDEAQDLRDAADQPVREGTAVPGPQ
jgi:peptidoglycan/LPS O-acetylase OafA/YrhL